MKETKNGNSWTRERETTRTMIIEVTTIGKTQIKKGFEMGLSKQQIANIFLNQEEFRKNDERRKLESDL